MKTHDKPIVITKREQKAIKSLQRVAKNWPRSLVLFSWSGSLCIFKDDAVLPESFMGIPNDGGDPTNNEINQSAEFEYL